MNNLWGEWWSGRMWWGMDEIEMVRIEGGGDCTRTLWEDVNYSTNQTDHTNSAPQGVYKVL